MYRFLLIVGFAASAALSVGIAAGVQPVKSGLQPHDKITTIFEPLNVTGEHAGEPYCLICENGLAPVAMLFARELDEPLLRLISKLDAATAKQRKEQMGSFVVFLSEKAGLQEELAAAAKKAKLKHTVLSIDKPEGPEGFKVSPEAGVTVVLYREHEVKANHAFRPGELTDAASERVLADLAKILVK
jgi:hypothetical protein